MRANTRPYPVSALRYFELASSGGGRSDDTLVPGFALSLVTPHFMDFLLEEVADIWPAPAASLMRQHSRDWRDIGAGGGELLRISTSHNKTVETIGVTGWFEVPGRADIVGLRWHGLLPQWRGRGLSALALRLLARRLSNLQPGASRIYDTVLPGSNDVLAYFERIGFVAAAGDEAESLRQVSEMPPGSVPMVGDLTALTAVPGLFEAGEGWTRG